MKKFVLYLIGILSVQCLSAQGLKVIYEESTDVVISSDRLNSIANPAMRERIEQKMKSTAAKKETAELIIGKNVSLYTIFETAEQPDKSVVEIFLGNEVSDKVRIRAMPAIGRYKLYYKNLEENQVFAQAEIGDTSYLIESALSFKWSIQKEEKIIAGYKCIQATLGNIVAWYCPDIPINDGPQYFYGLPGLILEIEIKGSAGGGKKYSCTSVTALTDTPEIQIGDGKKITIQEFEKLVTEYKESLGIKSTIIKF
jgi:GLPGLI family protein